MNIDKFCQKYKSLELKPIEELCDDWEKEREIENFLNINITAGVTVADYLIGDRSLDQISPELFSGFIEARKQGRFSSYDDLRGDMLTDLKKGKSIDGIVNNVKGKIGELHFKEEMNSLGINAELSRDLTQEGWDLRVPRDDYTEYIQVKTYGFHRAEDVINEIKKVLKKVSMGDIKDGDTRINHINFAVPCDLSEEVKEKVVEMGLDIKIYDFDLTADQAAKIVRDGYDNIQIPAFSNFFNELFYSSASVLALNAAAQAFLEYRRSKDINNILSFKILLDSIEPTLISSGSISTGMMTEAMVNRISMIGGLPTFILVFTTTIATREFLKRVAKRQEYVSWMTEQINHTRNLNLELEQINTI